MKRIRIGVGANLVFALDGQRVTNKGDHKDRPYDQNVGRGIQDKRL